MNIYLCADTEPDWCKCCYICVQTQNLMKLREGGEQGGGSGGSSSSGSVGSGSTSTKGKKTVAQRLRNAPPEQVDCYVITANDPSLLDS